MYKLLLISRYLLTRRLSHLSVIVLALCVFVVTVVMTVMSGLVGDFKQLTHDWVGDCVILTESLVGFSGFEPLLETLDRCDWIAGASPVVRNCALVNRPGQNPTGRVIMGLDPQRHARVTSWGRSLHYHRDDPNTAFVPPTEPNVPGMVRGIDLDLDRDSQSQYHFDAAPVWSSYIVTCFPLTPTGAPARAGSGEVASRRFHFSDLSHSGLPRDDDSVVYIDLQWAQKLCGMDVPAPRITAIHLRFKPDIGIQEGVRRVGELVDRHRATLAGSPHESLWQEVRVLDWKKARRDSVAVMEKEQGMMTLLFILVGVTTSFIILVVFYMMVMNKGRDIGILKSIGVANHEIYTLFLGFSTVLGMVASILGIVSARFFLVYINPIEDWLYRTWHFQIWDRTLFAIGQIPHELSMALAVPIGIGTILVCVAGALIPTCQAARLQPVEILQVSRL